MRGGVDSKGMKKPNLKMSQRIRSERQDGVNRDLARIRGGGGDSVYAEDASMSQYSEGLAPFDHEEGIYPEEPYGGGDLESLDAANQQKSMSEQLVEVLYGRKWLAPLIFVLFFIVGLTVFLSNSFEGSNSLAKGTAADGSNINTKLGDETFTIEEHKFDDVKTTIAPATSPYTGDNTGFLTLGPTHTVMVHNEPMLTEGDWSSAMNDEESAKDGSSNNDGTEESKEKSKLNFDIPEKVHKIQIKYKDDAISDSDNNDESKIPTTAPWFASQSSPINTFWKFPAETPTTAPWAEHQEEVKSLILESVTSSTHKDDDNEESEYEPPKLLFVYPEGTPTSAPWYEHQESILALDDDTSDIDDEDTVKKEIETSVNDDDSSTENTEEVEPATSSTKDDDTSSSSGLEEESNVSSGAEDVHETRSDSTQEVEDPPSTSGNDDSSSSTGEKADGSTSLSEENDAAQLATEISLTEKIEEESTAPTPDPENNIPKLGGMTVLVVNDDAEDEETLNETDGVIENIDESEKDLLISPGVEVSYGLNYNTTKSKPGDEEVQLELQNGDDSTSSQEQDDDSTSEEDGDDSTSSSKEESEARFEEKESDSKKDSDPGYYLYVGPPPTPNPTDRPTTAPTMHPLTVEVKKDRPVELPEEKVEAPDDEVVEEKDVLIVRKKNRVIELPDGVTLAPTPAPTNKTEVEEELPSQIQIITQEVIEKEYVYIYPQEPQPQQQYQAGGSTGGAGSFADGYGSPLYPQALPQAQGSNFAPAGGTSVSGSGAPPPGYITVSDGTSTQLIGSPAQTSYTTSSGQSIQHNLGSGATYVQSYGGNHIFRLGTGAHVTDQGARVHYRKDEYGNIVPHVMAKVQTDNGLKTTALPITNPIFHLGYTTSNINLGAQQQQTFDSYANAAPRPQVQPQPQQMSGATDYAAPQMPYNPTNALSNLNIGAVPQSPQPQQQAFTHETAQNEEPATPAPTIFCPQEVEEYMEDYHGPSGEDEAIYEIYYSNPIKRCGTIVEIGGTKHDGDRYSKSWYYEHALHWKSLLIQANPQLYSQMTDNRPNANIIKGGFCEGESLNYYGDGQFRPSGGLNDVASEVYAEYLEDEEVKEQISCLGLKPIFKEHSISKIDIMYIAVGGDALSVIREMDWTVRVDIWVIEMNGYDDRNDVVRNVLKKNEYVKAEWDITRWCNPYMMGQCMANEVWLQKGYNPLPNDGGRRLTASSGPYFERRRLEVESKRSQKKANSVSSQ